MVNFTTPNLPGASTVYNAIASKVDSIEKDVMSKLEVDASVLASSLSTDLTDLKAKTGSKISSNTKKEFTIFNPYFIDLYRKIKRDAQIIPLKDIAGQTHKLVDVRKISSAVIAS